jgi:hypothetical protein
MGHCHSKKHHHKHDIPHIDKPRDVDAHGVSNVSTKPTTMSVVIRNQISDKTEYDGKGILIARY